MYKSQLETQWDIAIGTANQHSHRRSVIRIRVMEGTSKLLFGLVIVSIAAGLSEAMCPAVACTYIMHPEMCRAPTFMVYNGELCERCTQCIMPTTHMDAAGCPRRPCPRIAFPPGCAAKSYFMWNDMMCPDCDVNTCKGDYVVE